MFLVVLSHRTRTHKRVVAARPHAVKMPVDLVVVTVRPSTVDDPLEELKPFQDGDVVVEIFSVEVQNVLAVGGHVTVLPAAVIVTLPLESALVVGTHLRGGKLLKPVDNLTVLVALFVQEIQGGFIPAL